MSVRARNLAWVLLACGACTTFGSEPVPAPDDSDAGADGGTSSDAARDAPNGSAFCERQGPDVIFCTDFESGPSSPPFGFQEAHGQGDGDFALVSAPDRGATTALRVRVNAASGTRNVELFQDLGGVPVEGTIELEADLRLSTGLDYGALAVIASTAQGFAAFRGVATYAQGQKLGLMAPPGALSSLRPATWYRVRQTLEVTATTVVSTLFVDGVFLESRNENARDRGTRFDFRLGMIFTSNDDDGAEVFYDNVVVRRIQR